MQMNNKAEFSGCTVSMHECRCFETLSKEELQLVDENSVLVRYKKGEVICKRGSFASHVMFLERGLAKVYIEDGVNTLVLKILSEKNLLGLASVSDEVKTFEYSVMAYIDSEIRQIDIEIFKKLLKQNPVFSKEVIDILSANSIQIYSRFFCLTHKQSFGRLADILLCLSDRVFKKDEFELPLSRKELAELSGLSSETVIRMLKVFREEGLIDLNGKILKVLDHDRMKQISETG
jgi:CRP/FNR family transcriptional regulator